MSEELAYQIIAGLLGLATVALSVGVLYVHSECCVVRPIEEEL